MGRHILLLLLPLLLLSGCRRQAPTETVEYNGNYYDASQLSERTKRWLEWYHSLSEEERQKVDLIPSEFSPYDRISTIETEP